MDNSVFEAARWMQQQGLCPLPLHPALEGQKTGKEPTHSDWGNYQVNPADFKNGGNIGLLLGKRSNGVVDVDLDWPEAVPLAEKLLPKSWAYGRPSRLTHLLYRSPDAKTLKLKAPLSFVGGDKRKQTIIELRAAGCQSVVPPSVLLPADRLEWRNSPEDVPLHEVPADHLAEAVQTVAGAALLVKLWADFEGGRHDLILALVGSCIHAGWAQEKVSGVFDALLSSADDAERGDRWRAVQDTLKRAADGDAITGLPTLADLLPPDLLLLLQKWWGLGNSTGGLKLGGKTIEQTAAEQAELPPPQPLPEMLRPAPEFPLDCLPDVYQGYVRDVSERMRCPPDFPAVGLMIVTGALVGAQIAVRPKQQDDWTEIPNLWGGIVGNPGLMKTPALAEPMSLLNSFEAVAQSEYEAAVAAYTAESAAFELQLREAKAQKADLKAVLAEKPAEPIRKRYIVSDATTEKAAVILSENPNGLLLFRDELTGWLATMDKERNSGDRQFYLECWTGKTGGTVDRIGRGTINIPRKCLSVLGGIQPGPMGQYLRQALDGKQGSDGLFQRLQLLVWPEPVRDTTLLDRSPDREAQQGVRDVLNRLHGIDVKQSATIPPVLLDGIPPQPYLNFTPEAQEHFNSWWQELHREIEQADSEAMQAHLSKYRGLIPSLALLTHLADTDIQGPQGIGVEALEKALRWYRYLLGHAQRIYSHVPPPELIAAQLVLKRLDELPSEFTARDLYRKQWAGIRTKGQAVAALDELCESYQLNCETIQTGGRTKTVYRRNKL